jgi:fructokinase
MGNIVCFGEILWDIFPDVKKIGGAPLNVALRLASFGHHVNMVSAVGKDELGDKVLDYIKKQKLNSHYIQRLSNYKTGEVQVLLDDKGVATYAIESPRAWDKIEIIEQVKSRIKEADAFVFGSLIARDEVSNKTLQSYLKIAKYKIFDLNLRPPFYSIELLISLMNTSDFIKFNDEELYEVSAYLGSKYHSLEQNLKYVSKKTDTKHICVTKGPFGAVLLYNDRLYYNSGYRVKVVDTVGAGDSFLGTLISQLLFKRNPQDAIDFACAVGALVAKSEGANPIITNAEIKRFINP